MSRLLHTTFKNRLLLFALFIIPFISSAQCIDPSDTGDCDGDLVLNLEDLDDDNDGILDTDEGLVYGPFELVFLQFPNHVDDATTAALIFDGNKTYTGNQDLRFHSFDITPGDLNASILDNALVYGAADGVSNISISAGTPFRMYMENDDCLNQNASIIAADIVTGAGLLGLDSNSLFDIPFVDVLPPGGDGIHDNYDGVNTLFLDRTGDGLTGDDFSRDGDDSINTEGVDFSPMGVIVQFYQGVPGSGGLALETFFAPIQLLDDGSNPGYVSSTPGASDGVITYDATTNVANFSHIVIASIEDGTGKDIRLIEMEANLIVNVPGPGGSPPTLIVQGSLDTDGDGMEDHVDRDKDNDGCPDAIEAIENVIASQLNPDGSINTTALGGVDSDGVPNLVNTGGAADGGNNTQGQDNTPEVYLPIGYENDTSLLGVVIVTDGGTLTVSSNAVATQTDV